MGIPAVDLREVGVTYPGPTGREVLRSVSVAVEPGEFVSIVGHSGIGKSTLIRCIAGLQRVSAGSVWLADSEVTEPPETLALVSQDYGRTLMPWLSVVENVRLPLRGHHMAKPEQYVRSRAALAQVDLEGVDSSYPWQLSGGMQQRVAIARALAYQPRVLLLDEPFASVDAQTRMDLEDLILELQRALEITVLLVTHDVDEAVYLGDRVIVLGGKPASVQTVVEVELGRSRDQLATKDLEEFRHARNEIFVAIRKVRPDVVSGELQP